MDDNRQSNGRFGPGNRANPVGRPKKDRSISGTILDELTAPVTITENRKRRRITKLAASAKQIVNQGASGEFRAAKLALDLARQVEREQQAAPREPSVTETDEEIVNRFIARLRATEPKDSDHEHD